LMPGTHIPEAVGIGPRFRGDDRQRSECRQSARFWRHSPFTLAAWVTLRHFGSSDLMYFASFSGAAAIDSKYCRSRKFFLMSGSAKILRTSALILATMSAGIPGGPNSPNHETAS